MTPQAKALLAYGDDGQPIPNAWSHAPSKDNWQATLFNDDQDKHALLYQFHYLGHSLAKVLARANFEAGWAYKRRFAVRDETGRVVFNGPYHDALGQPAKP